MYRINKTMQGEDYGVIRIADNAFIPFDEANVDFQQYQVWLSEGNIPDESDTNESL